MNYFLERIEDHEVWSWINSNWNLIMMRSWFRKKSLMKYYWLKFINNCVYSI